MTIIANSVSDVVTITLDNQFEFNSVEEFRKAYMENRGESYIIDFRNTDYMDSSGLGMLLNMRRHLEGKVSEIKLVNCRSQVKKILLISRFDQKFTIV